jgi:predicted nucleic acid-binding protein
LIEEIVNSCEIKLVDGEGARKAGGLRREYHMSLGDCFVAQLALDEGISLLTLDKKAFGKISGLKFYL